MAKTDSSPRSRPSRLASPGSRGEAAVTRIRELAPIVVALILLAAVLAALAVLPVQTWLTQRNQTADAEAELREVEADVAELQAELDQLQTDAEVERIARENFDLVYPGEESYRIVEDDGG